MLGIVIPTRIKPVSTMAPRKQDSHLDIHHLAPQEHRWEIPMTVDHSINSRLMASRQDIHNPQDTPERKIIMLPEETWSLTSHVPLVFLFLLPSLFPGLVVIRMLQLLLTNSPTRVLLTILANLHNQHKLSQSMLRRKIHTMVVPLL
jgi:hypothetical protein